jgi:hypothetical protein
MKQDSPWINYTHLYPCSAPHLNITADGAATQSNNDSLKLFSSVSADLIMTSHGLSLCKQYYYFPGRSEILSKFPNRLPLRLDSRLNLQIPR